jgi:hypothetical protein
VALFRKKANRGWEASLFEVQVALERARADAAVATEQLASLRSDAEEAQLRSLVSENTADIRDARHAAGHAERLEHELHRLRDEITSLEAAKEEILNRPLFDE